jgi:hypothetical protein
MASEQQMTGRGYRQEFGQPLEDAQDEGHKNSLIAVHLIPY